MSSLESKVVNWVHEEFSSSNLKINPKDVTRLITSKNGHLYIKLFSILSENFKAKSKYKEIKEASSLINEKKKRDTLKIELSKIKKDLLNLLSAIHQEEKRIEQETKKTEMMKTKETLFKSLSLSLEMIILFCKSFSKLQMPQADVDALCSEELPIKDLIPDGSIIGLQTRSRRKDINFQVMFAEINRMVASINSILGELAEQHLEVPKVSMDQAFMRSLLDHDCLKTNQSELSIDLVRERKTPAKRSDLGLSALKIISEYEELRTLQEAKLLEKLEQASAKMRHFVDKLPNVQSE